jgi:hypothetical protein
MCISRGTGLATALVVRIIESTIQIETPDTPPRPVQDEWGIYDPEQAGFAAILRKIREAGNDDADLNPSPGRT